MLIKSLDQLARILLLLLLLLKDHQDIKSRDQDTKTRQGGGLLALLCLLAWMDLARMDLACLDWIGKFSSG